jgi:nucleolin
MQGYELDGRKINLDWSTPRDNSAPKAQANDRARKFGDQQSPPSATIFVGNLSFEATPEEVRETFEAYGTVTRVSLPTDRETGAIKGFGYVDYTSVEEAKEAMNNLTGASIQGRPMRLDYGKPRDDNGGGSFGGGRGGSFGGRGGGGFGGRGGRGGSRGGRGGRGGFTKATTNRGGVGEFKGTKMSFD